MTRERRASDARDDEGEEEETVRDGTRASRARGGTRGRADATGNERPRGFVFARDVPVDARGRLTVNDPSRAQPRKGIHPLLHTLTLVATDGSTTRVPTTVKALGNLSFLSLDATNHPAYTGKVIKGPATGQAAKFKRKFDFLSDSSASAGTKK